MSTYILGEFEQRVRLPFESFERSYEIQEWCEATFGPADTGLWALAYGVETGYQSWYFSEGKNAMLFKLKWL